MSTMDEYKDILFDVRDGVARITINRPEKYNAFTRPDLRGTDRRASTAPAGTSRSP